MVRSLVTGQGYVYGVAFSPDGRILATSGQNGTVALWDANTLKPLGSPLVPPTTLRRPITGVAFSPDGRTLVTAGLDGTVRLWRGILWSGFDDLRSQVCGLVAGVLSESDWRNEWPGLAPGLAYEPPCPGGGAGA
jgi:WD40 repeat protein